MSSKQGLFILATCLLFHLIFKPVTSNECQPKDWLNDQQLPIEKANGDNSAKILNLKAEDLEELMKKFCNSLETNQQIAADEANMKFEALQLNYDQAQQTACDQSESKFIRSSDEKYESVLRLLKEDMNKLENIFTKHNNRILDNSQKYNILQAFYNYSNAAVTKVVQENDKQEQKMIQETLSKDNVMIQLKYLIEECKLVDRQLNESFSGLSAEEQERRFTFNGTKQTLQNFHDATLASIIDIKSQLKLSTESITSQQSLAGLQLAIQEADTNLTDLAQQFYQLKHNVDDVTSAIKTILKLQNMVHLGRKFYFFSKIQKEWSTARTFCHSHGLKLAIIETEEENNLVGEHFWKLHRWSVTWLGGTDEDSEGHWKWVGSEQALNFTDWYTGQPDSGTKANCLVICNRHVSLSGSWCDYPCEAKERFVCE